MSIKTKVQKLIRVINKDPYVIKVQRRKKCRIMGGEYGGFGVCLSMVPINGVVYSFGIGEDMSFDIDIKKEKDVALFAFDPTPKSISWYERQNFGEKFSFYPYGISNYDGEEKFYLPLNEEYVSGSVICGEDKNESAVIVEMKSLDSIMKSLNHKKIDVLKMDIEGSEYKVIDDILSKDICFSQLCIEVHSRFFDDGVKKTREMIKKLNDKGYYITYVSDTFEELTFCKFK
ncbi:MAG: FkbM family methyltransferase [Lachnospiraceae bacterium]|nr:FkbM family methyltransferase [Lachnospiraceae bacterium]